MLDTTNTTARQIPAERKTNPSPQGLTPARPDLHVPPAPALPIPPPMTSETIAHLENLIVDEEKILQENFYQFEQASA